MNWAPYIELLAKKPTSLIYTGFFKSLPQTMQGYFEQLQYQEKKIALNMLNRMVTKTDMDTAITTIALALEEGHKDTDSIWSTYYTLTTQSVIAKDIEINNPKVPNIIPFNVNMKKYDMLFKGGEKACSKGKTVKFFRTAALVYSLLKAKKNREQKKFLKQIEKNRSFNL